MTDKTEVNTPTEVPPAQTETTPAQRPQTNAPVDHLPKWNVILHNDDINEALAVMKSIVRITFLSKEIAAEKTKEAHKNGTSILLSTHREKAELYEVQFASCRPAIIVTIEPDE